MMDLDLASTGTPVSIKVISIITGKIDYISVSTDLPAAYPEKLIILLASTGIIHKDKVISIAPNT
jgi:hypothetical protein